MSNDDPYLTEQVTEDRVRYNPSYGDDRICACGHTYYRHFDPYEDMEPVGCKYCGCREFRESTGLLMQALVADNVKREKCIKLAHHKLTRLKEPIIEGTLHHKGYNGQPQESVVIPKWWLDRFIKVRKALLEGVDDQKECSSCQGRGYQEWPTGCPECGKSPPCESEDECPGPDEMCRTCKGLGKVPK